MNTEKRRILLAGGGDLCRRTGDILLAQGHDVWALRRHPPADDTAGLRWLAADLSQAATLAALPGGISHVLYAVAPGERSPQAYRSVFLDGAANLLAALNHEALRRFVFVSSSAVYGASEDWVDEDTPARPQGYNGEIVLEAENHLRRSLGRKAVTLRLSGLYGPGRTQLLDRLRQGRAAVIQDPPHWTNRMHIEDAARACAHLLMLDGAQPCYVGSDDRPMPMAQLYDTLADMLSAPQPPRTDTPRIAAGSKRLCNARLKASGFALRWPDAIEGYRALIEAGDAR
ncbi:NAD-dependent epimerase/dehydratase family protein [Pollutimonas sp. M17]|uniref:NAD-dependent epimerase/dehydratase family protein n=1 Tax=Pollutimonas sp. M17 TaxID=2962065 RepID=UPI0021F45262|nr:NAD-dependent epimerase/dehydratase family protein [Pollutimonas sp. M17]UYO92938.1 NAD-dependent epimerase/dehydratase family protein [Pollutimonas sp. M17]